MLIAAEVKRAPAGAFLLVGRGRQIQMPAESRTSILARLRAENEIARQELADALQRIAVLEAELAEARATVARLQMARCRGSG
jgi:hypothetical protein